MGRERVSLRLGRFERRGKGEEETGRGGNREDDEWARTSRRVVVGNVASSSDLNTGEGSGWSKDKAGNETSKKDEKRSVQCAGKREKRSRLTSGE